MVYNIFVKAILKSPLHGILSGSTMLVTYTGARSGHEYTVPVNYVAGNASQTLLTTSWKNRVWWRNFREARPVTLRLRGVDSSGASHHAGIQQQRDRRAGRAVPIRSPFRALL